MDRRARLNCSQVKLHTRPSWRGFLVLLCFVPGLVFAASSLADLPAAIDGLLKSPAEDAYLVVSISGTDDFVQLGGYLGTAFLDFPVITERQQELRDKVEAVCSDLGLVLETNVASNGAEFLDFELPGSANDMAAIVEQVLIRVYGVGPATRLDFETNGF